MSQLLSYVAAACFSLVSFSIFFLTPFLFLSQMLKIHYYIIRKDDEKTRSITKILQTQTMHSIKLFQHGKFYPGGYFMNWKCIGYYNYMDTGDNVVSEIHILTTTTYFQTLFEIEKPLISFNIDSKTQPKNTQQLTIYCRSGSYTCSYYTRMTIDINNLEPMGQQIGVTDDICDIFYKKRRGVFFIHGISGAGKSTVGFLVANKTKGTFCHTFNPTDPGDTLPSLLRDSIPCDETPTIIIIEEVNLMIHALHDGNIQKHKNVTTCIHNKSTYNTFMDDLIFYKNVLIIFTSNESKESIDALDPCYLRKGRVDGYYSMMDQI
jgi:hypothetical protein